jgi:parvulin-like peptidyl-prolyl isomerase
MKLHIWAMAVVTGLTAAGLARAQQPDPKMTVATVNGRNITMAEVDTVLKARPLAPNLPERQLKEMRFEALCLLIDGVLWEQFLQKNGPRIPKSEVDQRMAELEQVVKKAKKSMDIYYKETGQSETQVRAGILSILQWDAIAKGKISDADVKHYYDENKDFFDGVRVRASHIMLKVLPSAPEADRQKATKDLLAIRANIIAGTIDFEEAARRYSQCSTAPQGGDLGLFPLKMVIDEKVSRAAFALPVNGISDVVQSDYGLHLIKATERKAGEQPSDFTKIKDVVRDFCTEEYRYTVLEQQRRNATIKINLPK